MKHGKRKVIKKRFKRKQAQMETEKYIKRNKTIEKQRKKEVQKKDAQRNTWRKKMENKRYRKKNNDFYKKINKKRLQIIRWKNA